MRPDTDFVVHSARTDIKLRATAHVCPAFHSKRTRAICMVPLIISLDIPTSNSPKWRVSYKLL